MEKRKIGKSKFDFLKNEIDYYKESQIINEEQYEGIINLYDVKQKVTFVKVLLAIGAVLVGLGVLSFIASNWQYLGKISRVLIILISFIGVNFASYKLSSNYPKTSRSLLYIGAAIYGAGIFLIGQTFNVGGHFTKAFLWWCIGVLPMAVLFKDKILFMLCTVLALTYLNGHFALNEWPLWMIAIIPVFYYINRYFDHSRLVTFFNNLLALNTIGYVLIRIADNYNYVIILNETTIIITFFIIGLLMYFLPIKYHQAVFRMQGSIIFGLFGFILSFSDTWTGLMRYITGDYYFTGSYYTDYSYARIVSIVFSILFVVFLLILTRKGNIIPLIFICFTIFKFYFDISYNFMPKALFFIIGGIMLIGCGFYIERARRKLGGAADEE